MEHLDLITTCHAIGDSRDATIIALVSECGLSLNAATKAYAAVAKSEGWTTALVSHKDAALAWLHGEYQAVDGSWNATAVKNAVIDLVDQYGVAESTARDYCRAFSDELGVAYPVLDPRKAMFEWLVEHSESATKEEFKAFAGEDGLGRSDSNVNEYWKGLELHRAIMVAKG